MMRFACRSSLSICFASLLLHCGSTESSFDSGHASGGANVVTSGGATSTANGGAISGPVTSNGGSAGSATGARGGSDTGTAGEAGMDNAAGGSVGGNAQAGDAGEAMGGSGEAMGGAGEALGGAGAAGSGGSECSVQRCDDDDECTDDRCEGGECVHDNPTLDCSGWSNAICASDLLLATASGERSVCVPAASFNGVDVCGGETCGGAPGCAITYETDAPTVTRVSNGYRLEGTLTRLSGQISGSASGLTCTFDASVREPIDFVAAFTAKPVDCSGAIDLSSQVTADWTNIGLASTDPICALAAAALIGQINEQLNAALAQAFDTFECAQCGASCDDGIVCR